LRDGLVVLVGILVLGALLLPTRGRGFAEVVANVGSTLVLFGCLVALAITFALPPLPRRWQEWTVRVVAVAALGLWSLALGRGAELLYGSELGSAVVYPRLPLGWSVAFTILGLGGALLYVRRRDREGEEEVETPSPPSAPSRT